MPSPRNNSGGGLLLLALLLCALLTALHGRAGSAGRTDAVSSAVRDFGLVPGQAMLTRWGQAWHLSAGSLLAGPRLARENAALSAQVLALSAKNKSLLTEQAENIRLRRLLGFEQRSPRPLLAALVTALKPNPHSDTLTLNQGSDHGVHPHSVVLAPNGALVGQVLDVSARSCDVLLLSDAQSSIGALVHNHTAHGPIGLCQGDGQGQLRVTYLRSDTLLHLGDAVTTSGLGGIFPKAIPLGAISSISVDKVRSLQTALLRPSADFDHLEEVFVILPTPAPVPIPAPDSTPPASSATIDPPATIDPSAAIDPPASSGTSPP